VIGRRDRALAFVLVLIAATSVHAQPAPSSNRPIVALTGAALASVQPADNTYVGPGGPYLDRGLSGVGFGAAAGMLIIQGRLAAAGELSTGSVAATQQGRLVGGTSDSTLRDTMASGLVGIATESQRLIALIGISWLGSTAALNGVAGSDPDAGHIGLTGGVDLSTNASSRVALVGTVRYSFVARSQHLQQLGVGSQIVHAGFGIRLRLN